MDIGENPNAKWDYWTIGGRWKGFLKAKDGQKGGKFGNADSGQARTICSSQR